MIGFAGGQTQCGHPALPADRRLTEVLLVHPGGPFWAKKDDGAWSIPKGEYGEDEDPRACALREFEEETGTALPPASSSSSGRSSAEERQAGVGVGRRGPRRAGSISSNTFAMEWPPRSSRTASFRRWIGPAGSTLGRRRGEARSHQATFVEPAARAAGRGITSRIPRSIPPCSRRCATQDGRLLLVADLATADLARGFAATIGGDVDRAIARRRRRVLSGLTSSGRPVRRAALDRAR